ncbi:hypothetical protein EDD16DRAFT_1007627 [Pisolithus croceorrhizus]|nr:hypothetical protein EV401DRAFT_668187 [Pisolithus croceorrhizus]KAI6117340.1 hypothetical protein EDD16DRAFT_1007627 [Pisolithus croceorrhizus]KAI6161525.1 hypothetical protein EDD17DRAFT_693676 [Pisolithus thermaeus]
MDHASGQGLDSNSPPSSVSDTAPSPREPCTSKCSLQTGEGDLATSSGPLAENDLADDAIIHHSSTMARGWIEPDGETCDDQIDYHCEGHFATARGIRNMSWGVKVECHWCPLSAKQEVRRKVFIRHLRKARMKYWHPRKEEARTPWKRRRN